MSPPILPLTLSILSPCLVSSIGRGVRWVFTCTKINKLFDESTKKFVKYIIIKIKNELFLEHENTEKILKLVWKQQSSISTGSTYGNSSKSHTQDSNFQISQFIKWHHLEPSLKYNNSSGASPWALLDQVVIEFPLLYLLYNILKGILIAHFVNMLTLIGNSKGLALSQYRSHVGVRGLDL